MYLQRPQLQVKGVLSKHSPAQSIWYCIPSIFLDPPLYEQSIALSQKAVFVSFVGKVNNDEPCRNSDDLYDQTLDNLLQVSVLTILDEIILRISTANL